MSDMVYLLSMTYAGSDSEGGCVWIADDGDVGAGTLSIDRATLYCCGVFVDGDIPNQSGRIAGR